MGNISVETRRAGGAVEPSAPLGQSAKFETLRLPNPATKQEDAPNVALDTLLLRLDSDSFAERETATLEIAQEVRYRPEVERLLFRSEEDSVSLEARDRLQRALSLMWSDSPELQSLAALEAAFEGWNSITIGKMPGSREKFQRIVDGISSSIEHSAEAEYNVSVTALRSLGARAEVCQREEHFLRSCLDALREAPSAPTSAIPEQTLLLVGNELSRAVRDGGEDPARLRLRVAAFSECARRHGVEPTEIGALSREEASMMYEEVASLLGALRIADSFERVEQMGEGVRSEALAVCKDYHNALVQPLCEAIAAGDCDQAMILAQKIDCLNRGVIAIDKGARETVPEKHRKAIAMLYERVLAGDFVGAESVIGALARGVRVR